MNTHGRDTIQPDLRHGGSHPGRSRTHQPQKRVFRRARQRRPTEAKPGPHGRSKRSSSSKDGQVLVEDSRILQSKGEVEKIQRWRPHPSKGNSSNERSGPRQAWSKLGRTVQSRPLLVPGKLPSRRRGRKKTPSSMERRTSQKVLREGIIA